MPENKSRASGSARPKPVELDLSDPQLYWDGVAWVRNNVVLKSSGKSEALQLNVKLPFGQRATVFMNTGNHYIMGFQGADKVYLLDDPDSPRFKELLSQHLGSGSEIKILKGLSSRHDYRGLGTFEMNGKGKVFRKWDVESVRHLAEYSDGKNYAMLQTPLSLLVCMIAESARIPMMQMAFTNMFQFEHEVIADDAIRSYDDARYLISVSRIAFPNYPRRWAVEKLGKRAAELDSLLAKLKVDTGSSNRQKLLQEILGGRFSAVPGPANEHVKRLLFMAAELKISDIARAMEMTESETITQLVATCRSESAIHAAKEGVAFPAIGIVPETGGRPV